MTRKLLIPLIVCQTLFSAANAVSAEKEEQAIRQSQGVIGDVVSGFSFTNVDGTKIDIEQFRGKPLLATLIYTSCADVCPVIIESLATATEVAEDTFGPDSFNIITVGFDTRIDTPDRMRSFARAHSAGGENWYFVASTADMADRFATAIGFDYQASAGGFGHPAQVTVIDQDGKIFSQVYGSLFDPPAIVDPLKSLIFGGERPVFSLAGLGDRIKLFCTVYDPRTGRYYFDYSIVYSIAVGALCLLGILFFLVREARKTFRAGGA